ncbi:TonB family protein [Desulfurispirillum indicum S5]|uniref:TonB family protein n=2 Tax=Desulfurispirillum TaxID=393029 RepID=E6W2I6_DESIS|nr:TonB family protein [Desulfurispirillum indicum S5]
MTDAESYERLSSRLALLLTVLLGISLLAAMAAPEPAAREPLRPPAQPLTMAFASPPALPEIPSPPPPPVVKPVTLPEPPAERVPVNPVPVPAEPIPEVAPEPETVVQEAEQEQVPDEVIPETAEVPPADFEAVAEANAPVSQAAHESHRQADLLDELLRAVESEKFYPLPARRMGLEGELMITVTLDEQGRLVEFLIEEQGSHRLLRRAAEQTLERVARSFVADLSGSSPESLRFPLRYVLE